jgi:hypothetical protein
MNSMCAMSLMPFIVAPLTVQSSYSAKNHSSRAQLN